MHDFDYTQKYHYRNDPGRPELALALGGERSGAGLSRILVGRPPPVSTPAIPRNCQPDQRRQNRWAQR